MCVQSRIMLGSEFSTAYKALAHNDRGLPHESRINYEVRQKIVHAIRNGRARGQAARRTSLTLIRLHMGVGSMGHEVCSQDPHLCTFYKRNMTYEL